jgi:hypothetical protein
MILNINTSARGTYNGACQLHDASFFIFHSQFKNRNVFTCSPDARVGLYQQENITARQTCNINLLFYLTGRYIRVYYSSIVFHRLILTRQGVTVIRFWYSSARLRAKDDAKFMSADGGCPRGQQVTEKGQNRPKSQERSLNYHITKSVSVFYFFLLFVP